jgi:cytoskeletal protein RodZ
MKFKILLLVALMCAIMAAAVGTTLAGYAAEDALSFNITPDVTAAIQTTQQAQDTPAAQEDMKEGKSITPEEKPAEQTPQATDEAPAEETTPTAETTAANEAAASGTPQDNN